MIKIILKSMSCAFIAALVSSIFMELEPIPYPWDIVFSATVCIALIIISNLYQDFYKWLEERFK